MNASQGPITVILRRYNAGDQEAFNELIRLVYVELERTARAYLQHENQGLTLDTHGLVHEVYLKLMKEQGIVWNDRKHFFVVAARAMRRFLCDYARRKRAEKRGGVQEPLTVTALNGLRVAGDRNQEDDLHLLLSLDKALNALEEHDARLTRLVELRYFYGLSIRETADVMESSPATVKRQWQVARHVLQEVLRPS
ncbi:MAG: ECF-type sigma factor [Bacteroidota bacterium]